MTDLNLASREGQKAEKGARPSKLNQPRRIVCLDSVAWKQSKALTPVTDSSLALKVPHIKIQFLEGALSCSDIVKGISSGIEVSLLLSVVHQSVLLLPRDQSISKIKACKACREQFSPCLSC